MAQTTLIVDDDAPLRASLRMLLEASGFDVIGEAADGEEALAKALELAPDLILLDVQLPDFDGIEVARCLRREGSGSAVILMSARAASDYGSRLQQAGAVGFLNKAELSAPAIASMAAGT